MMTSASLGVDVGSVSTKGAVLDGGNNILAQAYLWTEGQPIEAVRKLLGELRAQLPDGTTITSVGTTGSARKLAGAMLGAGVVKNEITAHAVGTLTRHPDVQTILEIGGQDSKIILIRDGVVADYAMNTLCAAGTGAFLAAQAKRLGVALEDMGELALQSERPVKVAARCAVFAESDMVHKAQMGHRKEDLVAGLCAAVVSNYLGNVGQGKQLHEPVVFQGGVSRNAGVVQAFREATGLDVQVGRDAHLAGAVGCAVLAAKAEPAKHDIRRGFSFEASTLDFHTAGRECRRCPNRCDILTAMRGSEILDAWGNRCEKGLLS
jgi:predicted CoA-substrate-specific enzyme activase